MIQDYNKTKSNVLATYRDFCSLISRVKGDKSSSFDSSLKLLDEQVKNIKQDRFLLIVVGEAKSGKSTFINAYLGEEILPMDVKQCTSAIVKIRYGEKFTLTVTYADDTTNILDDEHKIKEFLNKNAAIDDKYRDIPISAINFEILMKYENQKIPKKIIDDFIKGVKDDNIYHLPEAEYNDKIRNYIKQKQPCWKKIVKNIDIFYPFADTDLKGVEIVDTPGVNADGRLGNITDKYMERANAVMFLKSIIGTALEASSFKQFLESKSIDRNKNAMFLILTRAANETKDNITHIHQEAFKQFSNINENQIIPIDSKVKLFYNRVKDMTIEEIEEIIQEEVAANRLDSFITVQWLMAQKNRESFLQKLMELSQFNVMNSALNQFSHKVQYIALNDLLTRMLFVIDKVKDTLNEKIELYKQKAVDPIELGNRINKIKAELEDMTLKIKETVNHIVICYNEVIDKRVNKEMNSYREEIAKIHSSSFNSIDELEKISFRKIDMLTQDGNKLQKKIVEDCDKTLISLSNKSSIKFTTIKPDITRETFKKVKEEFRNSPNAQETYSYETGSCFAKVTKNVSRFSHSKFFFLVKGDIEKRIERLKNQIINELKNFVTVITEEYMKELERNVDVKKEELNAILQEKKTAEEIVELEKLVSKLAPLKECIEILEEGVKKHV